MNKTDIQTMSIRQLSEAMDKKELSAEDVTRAYLKQIDKADDVIGAYLHINKSALDEAIEQDKKRKAGEKTGALSGIPVAVKDNICTSDMPTTCASKMLDGYMSPFDAQVVKKMKSDGAVILGKVNLDEFAMGGSTENSYYKKTVNPHDITRVPGGSSGGSAAAVAADMASFALGSDTGGSIRQPAGFCGLVGIKPTYGSVSRNGLIAFASSLDQIGPIARTVEDAAFALSSIAGHDALDATSLKFEKPAYEKDLSGDIKGMRIALPTDFFAKGIQSEVKEAVLLAAKRFEKMGAVVEEVKIENLDYALSAYYIISSAEASSNLARFDSVQYGFRAEDYEDLEELYKKTRQQGFGKEVKRRILLGTYALSSGYYDAYYKKALKVRTLIKNSYDKIFDDFDMILSPVTPTTAYRLGEKRTDPVESYLGDIYTVPVNIAGVPALSMNCGFDQDGMPIGMQLTGKLFSEQTLLKAAYNFEQQYKKEITKKGGIYLG